MLPAAIAAPLASTLGDRFRRERFLLGVAATAALALGASAVVFYASHSELFIFALAAVIGVASTLFRPALQAILPSLARSPEELIAANGATSTIESLGTLIGPLLAGLLVAVWDPGVAFAAAGGILAVGAILLAPLRVEGVIQETAAHVPVRELLRGGFEAVRQGPALLILALMATQGFVRGCLNVLIVVAAFRVLDAGDGAVGVLTAALGLGGLFGAFGAMTLQSRRLAFALGVALIFWGLPIALLAPKPYLPAAVLLLAVVGAANSVEDVAGFTLLQRTIPDVALSRALGLVWGAVRPRSSPRSVRAPRSPWSARSSPWSRCSRGTGCGRSTSTSPRRLSSSASSPRSRCSSRCRSSPRSTWPRS
jgi:Na+/melibiose symporter-like transporter